MKSSTGKIVPRWSRMFSVIIDAPGDTTLDKLHDALLDALEWDADHLCYFFLSRKAWDGENEYSTYDCGEDIPLPWPRDRRRVQLKRLATKTGSSSVHLFDFGGCHEFDIEIPKTRAFKGKGSRSVVVERRGVLPEQYPQMDD